MNRAIILNRKQHDEQRLAALLEAVSKAAPCPVTTAKADYCERIRYCEGWKGWTATVPTLYDILIVPDHIIGRATADILGPALAWGKTVVYTEDGQRFWKVRDFKRLDGDSWIDWAELVLEEP